MNAPIFPKDAEQTPPEHSPPDQSAVESEIGNLVEQEYAARPPKAGYDGERIMASVAVFTSKSIKELEGLTFELCGLQEFLKSETERVQRDIDSAMAGLKVIIDTISPWRSTRSESPAQERNVRHESRHPRFNLASGQK
jgi:hypothetical protein